MGIVFQDVGSKRLDIGSQRIATPEETLARFLPMAGKFGVTRIANVTGLDKVGIPVTLAIRPNSRSVAVSQGKGTTLAHAKVSALMETIEIWHAENPINTVIYGSQRDLETHHELSDHKSFPKVPGTDFTRSSPCLWVEGIDLISGQSKLVPYEMVHADYTRPIQPMHGYFPSSTNGLASGNSDLEAVCHAICEIVERDALTLWHFAQESDKAKKRIDPRTIQDAECNSLFALLDAAGLEFGLWDITSDTGIACILCLIQEAGNQIGHIGLGSGCHLVSDVAIRRSITEAAQTRLNYISGARDDLAYAEFERKGIAHKNTYVQQALSSGLPIHDHSSIANQHHNTLAEDLEYMLNRLQTVGIEEVIWVCLTRTDFNIPVARLLIPGLETPHDDANYQMGSRAARLVSQ